MATRRSTNAGRRRLPGIVGTGAAVALIVLVAVQWLGGPGSVGPELTGSGPGSSGLANALPAQASPSGTSPAGPASSPPGPTGGASGPSRATAATPSPSASGLPVAGRFGLGLLIADRGNGRLLIVDDAKRILWRFPATGSLPNGQRFSADDAFISPDGRTIVANDEAHQVIDRIDIVTRKVIWQYGHYDRLGSAPGYLHTPDDAYPLANGDIVVADIRNCRILEISPAKQVVRHWGRAGSCSHRPPFSYDNPNGDTPLPDGGLLITEIGGSRVVRLSAAGKVVFDIHVPVQYPSDAQLDADGNVIIVDYSSPGAIVKVDPHGHVLWRYRPATGTRRLDHPSLAIPLPDGTIALNDDFRHRVIVVDPRTNGIVWQYGRTDVGGRATGQLLVPDGIDPIPAGTVLH